MKILKTIWFYIKFGFSETWLFTIYMITRILKAPFWDITIDPYGSWRCFNEQITRDTAITVVLAIATTGFYLLSWWWFLIALAIALINFIAFILWLWRKSRKNDSDIGTTIAVLKSKFRRK